MKNVTISLFTIGVLGLQTGEVFSQTNLYPATGAITINSNSGSGRFITVNDNGGGNLGAFESTTSGDIHIKALSSQFATDQLYLKSGGNVGIGTTNPTSLLHLKGTDPALAFTTVHNGMLLKYTTSQGGATQRLSVITGALLEEFSVLNNGNVGIGTITPNEKLSVNGKIRAKEVKVETTGWPDYVFSKSYNLPDLRYTAQFIKENRHLPGMPSAAEVERDGIELGQMNAALLKKIEELTLHLIKQEKRLDEQDSLIKALMKKEVVPSK